MLNMGEEEMISEFQQLLPSPKEVLGLQKFYTDEFDAFSKYYAKINQCMDENSVIHLVNAADRLPYQEACDMTEKTRKLPKSDDNIPIKPIENANNSIEFAHSCLKIAQSDTKGRHLITTTHVERGQILINEKVSVLQVNPVCVCMEGENKMYRCHHCAYAVDKFYSCAGCNIVIYCSVDCLVESFNDYHRFECEGFQRHYWKLDDTDYSYMAFRMILYGARYNFNHDIPSGKEKWGNEENNYPYIHKLETNFNEIPVRKVYEILQKAAKTVAYLIVRTNFFSEFRMDDENVLHIYVGGLFVKHYCQAQMNAVLLRYPHFEADSFNNSQGGTGKAICPTVALLNHSCTPNAVIIPSNDRIIVRALRPLQANEEITIAYQEINTFFSLEERQLLMSDYFYFNTPCDCRFCTYESTWQDYPYKCRNCAGFAKKVTFRNGDQKLSCRDCKSYSYVDTKSEKLAEIADRTTYHIDPIIRVAESYDQIFPWDSWMLLDTYRILYDKFAGWGEKPIETMKYGLMYFKVLERYLSRLYPTLMEAKLKFFRGIVNTSEFSALQMVTNAEYATVKYFIDEAARTHQDLEFYIPSQYVPFYSMGIFSKLETVQRNLRIVSKKD